MPADSGSRGRKAQGADLVIPGLALALTLYFLFSISGLPWEAQVNAAVIGSLLLVLVTAFVARLVLRLRKGEATLGFDKLIHPVGPQGRRFGLIAVTMLFIAAMPWLGLTLALFLGMAAGLAVMGVTRWRLLVAVPFGVAFTCYVLFIALLNARMPHGLVENLLSALF